MQLARIDGTVTGTACHPSMRQGRTVICQPLDQEGRDEGVPVLALDQLGAGLHQRVIVSAEGSVARQLVRDERSQLRNVIVAIVDPDSSPRPSLVC
jgi:microcompartment protein CcmK/EutM